jgi:predicted transcriptional regulator
MKPIGRAVFSTVQNISNGIGRAASAIEGQGNLVDALILQRRIHDIIGDTRITIVAVQKDQSMREALAAMSAHRVGMLFVYQNSVFAGILCGTEMRQAAQDDGIDKTCAGYMIAAKKTICINHDDSVEHAIEFFHDYRIKRLIVMKDGKPVAVLTIGMLLRWIGRELIAIANTKPSSLC